MKWSLGCKRVWELIGHIRGRDSMQSIEEVVGHKGPACLGWRRRMWQKISSAFWVLQAAQPMPMAKFALSLQRFFAQIKSDGEEANYFQFKSWWAIY